MSDREIITLIMCGWILLHIFYVVLVYIVTDGEFPVFFTPKDLYQHSKINIVGCLVLYILFISLIPIFTIGGVIKWLFTVGRRD